MFEKESKEYAIGLTYPKFQDSQIANIVLRDVEGGFQKGAEFGYNKAKEQLTKAKEIIKTFLGFAEAFSYSPSMDKFISEAEQFIKDNEVEKWKNL